MFYRLTTFSHARRSLTKPKQAKFKTTQPALLRLATVPEFIDTARPRRHCLGDRWFVDETSVKIAGRWTYLYRAIDQHGQVVDIWLSRRRDLTAAREFFGRALALGGAVPGPGHHRSGPGVPAGAGRVGPSAPAHDGAVWEQHG
jgi:hypothetical protein